jgi:hypothetical protein
MSERLAGHQASATLPHLQYKPLEMLVFSNLNLNAPLNARG